MKKRRNARVMCWPVLCLLGCSDGHGFDVPVGSTTLALDADCAWATPVATFPTVVDFTSVRTYNSRACGKGQVVASESFESRADILAEGGQGGFGGRVGLPTGGRSSWGSVEVAWADTVPTDEASCTSAWVAAYRFWDNGTTYVTEDFKSAVGTWINGACLAPRVTLTTILMQARHVFAVSARVAPTSAAATRRVSVKSLR